LTHDTLKILDSNLDPEPDICNADIALWSQYSNDESCISIPALVEAHGERLRGKYISFISRLGRYRIKNKSLIEHFALHDDFSMWWMSQLAEKSPFKSKEINNCIKLFALEELLQTKKYTSILLITANKNLYESIYIYSTNQNYTFTGKLLDCNKTNTLRTIYDRLPYIIRGAISLRHVLKKWELKKVKIPAWHNNKSIFYCSYFYNLITSNSGEASFYSRQWEGLPVYLEESGYKGNWIHHYLDKGVKSSVSDSIDYLNKLNNYQSLSSHVFLDAYLTSKILFKVITKWIRFCLIKIKLNNIEKAFRPDNSANNFWPLLRHDWKTSLCGPICITNLLWAHLFESALENMPKQKIGFYLWENQGWECALNYAWSKYGHGKLIAIQHAAIRFWGTNAYDHVDDINNEMKLHKPLPFKFAVNGRKSKEMFITSGLPEERMIEIEAMRYQYLLEIPKKNANKSIKKQNIKLLVLGDFDETHTRLMLECVNKACLNLDYEIIVNFKSHPSLKLDINIFRNISINICNESLSTLIESNDIGFSGNMTSGSVDMYIAGLPTAVFLDSNNFNFSPLRGEDNINFITNDIDLIKFIETTINGEYQIPSNLDSFFYLDKNHRKLNEILNQI